MPGGDNKNWAGGAGDNPDNPFSYRDENVVVSNGTAKLKVKKEHYEWRCDTCAIVDTRIRDYTGGMIALPYFDNTGRSYFLNSGYTI